MSELRTGNISDWQLCNELNNIVQSIYFVAIMKYCAEEAVKVWQNRHWKRAEKTVGIFKIAVVY